MKKIWCTGIFLLLMAVMTLSLAGCGNGSKKEDSTKAEDLAQSSIGKVLGSARASALNLPKIKGLKDVLIKKEVLLTESSSQYDGYDILYYGSDTKVVKAWHNEIHYDSSTGVTPEGLKSIDLETVYPGISSLDFVSTDAKQQGDLVCWLICISKLDNPDNVKAAVDCGLIKIENYK